MLRNSSISATAFERLARDPSALVRRDLAGNTALPQSIAVLLAGDPVPEVRSTLAQRKDAQPAVIQVLSSDADPLIRNTIATHPATPDDVRGPSAVNACQRGLNSFDGRGHRISGRMANALGGSKVLSQ